MEWVGSLGLALLMMAWVPQTWDTIKNGKTPLNLLFILLYMISSLLLTIYAIAQNDTIFIVLNSVLTFGSAINLYFKIWPRKESV